MVDDSILSTNQQKINPVIAAKDRKASSNLCTRWRENFYAIYLMVLINKLTFSQQSASIAQFDSKLSVGLTLGLYIIGKLVGNIFFSKVVIRYQIRVALLCSTFVAIFASAANLTMFYVRDKLHSRIAEAALQCIIQFLIGIGTGNKGAITTYISATVKGEDLPRANLRISCYENAGYTLGPLTVVLLTYIPDPTLVSSLAHIATQCIIVVILLLMKTDNAALKVREDQRKGKNYTLLFKTILHYLPLSTCSCVFSLYVAVAVSISKYLFSWDSITLIRYHAPTLLVASLLSTFIAYNLKAAMKNNNIKHVPRTAGVFMVLLSMITLVPAMITIADTELDFHHHQSGENSTSISQGHSGEQSIYHGLTHMWLITCGLALASFGNVICKVNYFSSTAREVKGHPSHMGIIAAVWWFTSGFVTLLYGLIASMHFTVIIFPTVVILTFFIIFLVYYIHWVMTCRKPPEDVETSVTQEYPTISQLAALHFSKNTSASMLYHIAIYPFYNGGFHDQKP